MDEPLKRLERQASLGGPQTNARYNAAKIRAGQIDTGMHYAKVTWNPELQRIRGCGLQHYSMVMWNLKHGRETPEWDPRIVKEYGLVENPEWDRIASPQEIANLLRAYKSGTLLGGLEGLAQELEQHQIITNSAVALRTREGKQYIELVEGVRGYWYPEVPGDLCDPGGNEEFREGHFDTKTEYEVSDLSQGCIDLKDIENEDFQKKIVDGDLESFPYDVGIRLGYDYVPVALWFSRFKPETYKMAVVKNG